MREPGTKKHMRALELVICRFFLFVRLWWQHRVSDYGKLNSGRFFVPKKIWCVSFEIVFK